MKQIIVLIIAAVFLFASCGDISSKDHENPKTQPGGCLITSVAHSGKMK